MKIETKYLGQVEIDQEEILDFPKGILGFEDKKKFVVLELADNKVFKFLQSIDEAQIAFLIVNPWDFFPDYDIELPDDKLERININPKGKEEFAISTIVTLGKSFKESTTNLLAPLLINTRDKKGKQFVLHDSPYGTKHNLFPREE